MSVAVSLPGLVSQRQCKVTARRTRASRFGPLCNSPQPPFPAQRPAPRPSRPRPISRCLSVRFSILAYAAPTVSAATFRRATYFLCSVPAPFTTHATAAITAYSPPHRRPQKNNLSYRQRHRALQRFVGKSVNWLLLNIPT